MNTFNENDRINLHYSKKEYNLKNIKNEKLFCLLFIIIILNLILTLNLMMKEVKLQRLLKESNLKNDNLKMELNQIKLLTLKNVLINAYNN